MADHDSIARSIADQLTAAYDLHVISFLKKHGINVDRRNVAETLKLLEAKGLKLVVETESMGLQVTTYKFYLTKIIDKTELKMSYTLNYGNEKK